MSPDPVSADVLAASDDVGAPQEIARNKPLTRPRPGHADLAGMQKYGFDDARPVLERASARETAARVALGTVAQQFLRAVLGAEVVSHVVSIGTVEAPVGSIPSAGDVAYLDGAGLLTERTCLAHAVHTDAADWDVLRSRGTSVAHCPKSNAKFGHGIAPLTELRRAGVEVGLGSDGMGSNSTRISCCPNRMDTVAGKYPGLVTRISVSAEIWMDAMPRSSVRVDDAPTMTSAPARGPVSLRTSTRCAKAHSSRKTSTSPCSQTAVRLRWRQFSYWPISMSARKSCQSGTATVRVSLSMELVISFDSNAAISGVRKEKRQRGGCPGLEPAIRRVTKTFTPFSSVPEWLTTR
jgi:hypothetical protein